MKAGYYWWHRVPKPPSIYAVDWRVVWVQNDMVYHIGTEYYETTEEAVTRGQFGPFIEEPVLDIIGTA